MKRFFAVLLCLLVAVPACAFWPFGSDSDTPYVTQEGTSERVAEDHIRSEWSETALWQEDPNPPRVTSIETYRQVAGGTAMHLTLRLDTKVTPEYFLSDLALGVSGALAKMARDEKLREITEFRLFCEAKGRGVIVKMNFTKDNAAQMEPEMYFGPFYDLSIKESVWTSPLVFKK